MLAYRPVWYTITIRYNQIKTTITWKREKRFGIGYLR